MTCKKHKNIWKTLNYIGCSFILASTFISCVSISNFASVVSIPMGITNSAVGLKICVITAGIEKCNSIIKKTR